MADVVTSIRIDADTKAAVAEMARMEAGMNVLSKRAVPALGGAFGALSSQAISMTTGFSGASGVLAAMGQTMLTMSPIIGGVAIAAAAVTTVILKQKDSFAEATEVIRINRDALQAVADANVHLSAKAKELIAIRDKAIQQELLQIELRIKLAESGLREASAWDRLLAMVTSGGGVYAVAASQTNMVTVAGDAQTKMLTELIAKWSAFNKEIGTFDETAKSSFAFKPGAQIGESGMMTMMDELDRQRTAQLSGMGTAGPMGTEQQQAALEAFKAGLNERTQIQFEAAQSIAQMEQMYRDLGLQQDAAYSDAVIQIKDRETARLAALDKKQAKEFSLGKELQLKAAVGTAAQMLILQNASLRETIAAVLAERQAHLASLAVVALAEGVYYSFTNPAIAASKFKAAAMAGGGAIALGAIGSAFGSDMDQRAAESSVGASGTGGGRSQSNGRTLVSQGPVTLYYSATFVVQGHVFDKTDIFNEFSMWNMENLRRAGFDAGQRAKS